MFEFDSYHFLLTAIGGCIVIAYWLPRFMVGREPAASGLLILAGALAFSVVEGMPIPLDPTTAPRVWEILGELAVIVALFGAGLRIDDIFVAANWRPTVGLLAIGMPVTIVAFALLAWGYVGMTVAGAVLLAAALAPTDPVLAGDLQVGRPLEGGEHPVRFALTTEAGLNDGLAFPFVMLALLIAEHGPAPDIWVLEWLVRDVVYRIAIGALGGALVGWVLGKITFAWPRNNALANTESGVLAFAGVLVAYGATELLEGYGFIAAFVTGLILRRAEERHEFHRRLHVFGESVEHALTAVILVLLGGALPKLWPHLSWTHLVAALLLILVIRPLAGWLSLVGTRLPAADRGIVAFYGIRGIGSIYYLSYATGKIEFDNEPELWAMVGFAILASTVVHGVTASAMLRRFAN